MLLILWSKEISSLRGRIMNTEILKKKLMDDESLSEIIGGAGNNPHYTRIACCKCHRNFPANISKATIKCPYCGEANDFAG